MTAANTVLQRLLKYPHGAVFDKSPQSEPVLRLRHDDGMTWQVADEKLTVTADDQEFCFQLDQLTIGTLASGLAEAGFEVSPINPDFAGLSATVLVEGSGNQGQSNGDRLSGFKSLLWSQYAAYAKELRIAGFQVIQALRQMIIYQAEGEWLDLWGFLYNTPRLEDELDPDYAERIPREAFRIRVNAYGIEKAVLDATGKDIRIEEPWRFMFRLDESQLSGTHRFYDGSTVGPHLIRPVSLQSIDWSDVLPVIHRNRAAGIIVLEPETRLGSWVDAELDGTVWVGMSSLHGSYAYFQPENRLCYLVLSDETITRNWPVMMSSLVTIGNTDALLDPVSIAFRRTIAKASICLSEGPPLGDENAIFPRAELTQLGGKMHVSDDLVLSDPDQKPVWKPVDVILSETHAFGEVETGEPEYPGLPALNQEVISTGCDDGLLGEASHIISPSAFVFTSVVNTPVAVGMTMTDTSGYTWLEVEVWGDLAWNTSKGEVEGLEGAADELDDYVNNKLPGDLS